MRFYCEKYIPKELIVLDIQEMEDLKEFNDVFNVGEWKDEDPRSLIVIKNYNNTFRNGPKQGKWYDIPLEFFRNIEFRMSPFIEGFNEITSLVIRMIGDAKKEIIDFDKYLLLKSFNLNLSNPFGHELIETDINNEVPIQNLLGELPPNSEVPKDKNGIFKSKNLNIESKIVIKKVSKIELTVRNVGCANLNEIEIANKDFKIIYDLGTDLKWNGAKDRAVMDKLKLEKKDFHLILSHWDLDHVKGIFSLNANEFSKMNSFTAPNHLPHTSTYNNAIKKLKGYKIKIVLIPPFNNLYSKNRIYLIPFFSSLSGRFTLYRSTNGANSNYCGIVLQVHGHNNNALLTGDHSYTQLYRDIVKPESLSNLVIVVPHHCGNSGKLKEKQWEPVLDEAIISTRHNVYKNLPILKQYNFFTSPTINGECTDCTNKDIVRSL